MQTIYSYSFTESKLSLYLVFIAAIRMQLAATETHAFINT